MSSSVTSLSNYTPSLNPYAITNIAMQNDEDSDNLLSLEESGLDEESFVTVDVDEDGYISEEELQDSVAKQLVDLAAGDLTQDEFNEFISTLGVEIPDDITETLEEDYMTEATSKLLEALFDESDDEMGLSDLSYYMTVVNSQTQDPITADQLSSYIENLTSQYLASSEETEETTQE